MPILGRAKRSWEEKGLHAPLVELSLYRKLIKLSEKRIAHFSNSLTRKADEMSASRTRNAVIGFGILENHSSCDLPLLLIKPSAIAPTA